MRKTTYMTTGRCPSQALGLSEDKSRFLSRGNPNPEKIRKEFSEKLAAYLQSDEKATPCRNGEEREETWLFPEYEVEEGKIYNRLEGSVRPDAEIEVLGLGARGFRILVRENIRTVSQLLLCTEERLAGFAQMGQKTVEEIVGAVTDYLAGGGPGKPENSQTGYVIENGRIRHTGSGRLIDDAGIHSLGLSVRALGALQRNGICTVSQLLFLSKEELMDMPSMGKKSVDEVCEAVNRYVTRPKDSLHETPMEKPAETVRCEADTRLAPDFIVDNGRFFRRDTAYEIEDSSVDVLGLGVRAANCLSRNAIFRLSQLIGMTGEELCALKYVGAQSAAEIKQKLRAYLAVAPAKQAEKPEEEPKLSLCTEQDILALYETDPFALFTIEDIQAKLPDGVDPASVPAVVQTLLESGKMNRDQDRYGVVYETADGHIRRLLAHIPSTDKAYRFWNVLLNRLEGKTLEEIGQTLAISRERVRQLEKRALEALEREGQILEEDRYRYVYTTYRVEKEFFSEFLQAPALWHYLSIRYKGGSRDLEDALEDRHLSVSMRRHIERWVYRHCIRIDGMFLPAHRSDIEDYIAKVSCRDGVALEEFFSLYQAFLQEHHIHDERLALTEQTKRSRSNRLADSMHFLWKQNQRLRYYDIEGGDYTELLETLQLEQYADVEISTRKFLMDYPDLMKRYDIRDEYELHNLLKKIHAETRNPTLRFSRMPILIFGTFDCTAAVKEMLIALAPVSVNDLADALSRTYGHRKETVLANWLPRVSEYYHQGMCVADCDDMPQDHVETLKRCLTGDFYFLWEVRRLYRENVPGADLSLLTPYNLKKMGFFTGTSYILQHIPRRKRILKVCCLPMTWMWPRLAKGIRVYRPIRLLASLKHSRTIIEFEPYQYINRRRLEKLGVDKQALDRYGEDVWNFLTDGSYFSIQSLRQNGFQAELDTLGFGDLFYASLLKEDGRFAWQRVGNTVIFSPAGQNFSAREFLAALIEREESIDVGEFVRKLHDQYGVVMDRSDVLEKIKDSTVYFDKIMDKLYADYEIYFEEI
ncbi:MAG: DNA-directed RNA polymerase subunit alpha C-terminal domain-containing protein [Acutalibacteraceae bacterium]